jgi:hypothetical protein
MTKRRTIAYAVLLLGAFAIGLAGTLGAARAIAGAAAAEHQGSVERPVSAPGTAAPSGPGTIEC